VLAVTVAATGDDFTATAEAALAVPVPTVTLAPGSTATEAARVAVVTVGGGVAGNVAGTGVQIGRGVGLAMTVVVAWPLVSNGVMMPEVAGVAVGGSGVGDGEGDGDGDMVPLLAVAVGGAVGVTHADAISVAAPAEPVDQPSMIRSIPAVSAAPVPTTSRCCLPLCPSIPLPLVPRRSHSLYLAQ
jgi:hypothetical protein